MPPLSLNKTLNRVPYFEVGVWSILLVLGLWATLNHAMWRDELNGWLIARDSLSGSEFWQNIRYEGHPILWYLILLGLNQFTLNPVAMQIVHLAISLGAIAILLRYAPFTRLQKLLLVFGYLPFYEYLIISRNYGLGMTALFGFCALYPWRQLNYLPLAACLAVMANSNAYGLMISLCLAVMLGVEWGSQRWLKVYLRAPLWNRILSSVIVLAAVALSVWMLLPPGDSTLQGGADQWFFQWDFHRVNQALTRIWNSYILVLVPGDARPLDVGLFAGLSALLLLLWSIYFSDYPLVMGLYLLATGGIVLFTYLKFLGSARHYGHLYLILITCYWLKAYYAPTPLITWRSPKVWQWCLRWSQRLAPPVLMVILVCQLAAGWVGFGRDITLPYSASRAVANYLKAEGLDGMPLVGSEDFAVSPISGYLGVPIYYPESQDFGSFVLFNGDRQPVDDAQILQQIAQRQNLLLQPPLLLILNRPLGAAAQSASPLTITPVQEFRHAFHHAEHYYLYRIE